MIFVSTTKIYVIMSKTSIINVQGIDISITRYNQDDYICLTDMVKAKNGENRAADIIKNWIRNRGTIEFLGTWESFYNPNFKVVEFDHFKKEAGLHSFTMSVNNWIEKTNAIGIISKLGRYGGTYAHKDIAFEFGSAISPVFKLYLIKEFQRLKEIENNQYNIEWNVKRVLSKANYQIQTSAIKNYVLPQKSKLIKDEWIYADEADMLNIIMFNCTAKEWRELNKERALSGENIRDMASINELNILSNLESLNATLIKKGIDKKDRYTILLETADDQRKLLNNYDYIKSVKKIDDTTFLDH